MKIIRVAEDKFDSLIRIMTDLEKGINDLVMDGRENEIESLIQHIEKLIQAKGLQEEYEKHNFRSQFDYVIERAKEKAARYSQQGEFFLFDEGSPASSGYVIGKDEFGDPKFGPQEHAIKYPSYGEAESAKKDLRWGLDIIPV
jgi:hypothetical protein